MKKLMLNILDILGVMVFVLLLILLSPLVVGIMLYQMEKDGGW